MYKTSEWKMISVIYEVTHGIINVHLECFLVHFPLSMNVEKNVNITRGMLWIVFCLTDQTKKRVRVHLNIFVKISFSYSLLRQTEMSNHLHELNDLTPLQTNQLINFNTNQYSDELV